MKHAIILFLYSILEFLLGRSKTFVANSLLEMVLMMGERLISKVRKALK